MRRNYTRLGLIAVLSVAVLTFWRGPTYDQGDLAEDLRELQEHISQGFVPDQTLDQFVDKVRTHPLHLFDWSELLDLSKTPLTFQNLNPRIYPHLVSAGRPEMVSMPPKKRTTQSEHAAISMIYAKRYMPIPRSLLVLGPGKRRITVSVNSSTPEKLHRQYGLDPGQEQKSPRPAPIKDYGENLNISLPEELFSWPPPEMGAKQGTDLAAKREWHSLTQESAMRDRRKQPKHFKEANVWNAGSHFDWRFFRSNLAFEDNLMTVRRVARAWGEFSHREQIVSWYAHGSALGWYWNGRTLPWDTDNDVQMPILEMDRLARDYNGTLVFVNNGAYLIEINPWYVDRSKEKVSRDNIIDGRFIDIETGMYVDLTALSQIGDSSKVACKSPHQYSLDDLSPIRRTAYESAPAYVTNTQKLKNVLHKEYGPKFSRDTYEKWAYNEILGLWTREQPCNKRTMRSDIPQCPPIDPIEDCSSQQLKDWGTCNKFYIEEYKRTKAITARHSKEVSVWPLDKNPVLTPLHHAQLTGLITS